MAETDWEEHIQHHREEKDQFFKEHPRSPLPPNERSGFNGLTYYPIDPDYRFVAPLEPAQGDDTIEIPRTAGDTVTYQRAGTFTLDLPDATIELTAYHTGNNADNELFIPFKDATNGDETYGAGRYLETHKTANGWLVDFNQAYHPFCAYDEAYTCPLPPPENHAKIPIRAGEKLPE